MNHKIVAMLWGTAATLILASAAYADGSGLPGDKGRPREGVPAAPAPANAPPTAPASPGAPKVVARGPGVALALLATQAIAEACKQYPLAIAVLNSAGEPILTYIPDGSSPGNGYNAIRKGYTAITFKAPTSQLAIRTQSDAEFVTQVKADPSLMAFAGGILLKVGEDTVGAIGVSGAEPGHHDEECGVVGLEKIKSQLK